MSKSKVIGGIAIAIAVLAGVVTAVFLLNRD